eukprot:UN08104
MIMIMTRLSWRRIWMRIIEASQLELQAMVVFFGYKPNIEELEMLLEAYFVQIDGTLNKLSHLREYVDDTEDYINIMLDDKQNQLLQMGVMRSTATVVITAGVAVVGLFGMNIGISLYTPVGEEQTRAAHVKFWETTFGTIAGCTILYDR